MCEYNGASQTPTPTTTQSPTTTTQSPTTTTTQEITTTTQEITTTQPETTTTQQETTTTQQETTTSQITTSTAQVLTTTTIGDVTTSASVGSRGKQLHTLQTGLATGADYGLGTIGTCLGPQPSGGPHLTKKKKFPLITVKKRKGKS